MSVLERDAGAAMVLCHARTVWVGRNHRHVLLSKKVSEDTASILGGPCTVSSERRRYSSKIPRGAKFVKNTTGGSFKDRSVWGRASFSTTRHWNVVKLCHHPQQVPRVRANTRKKLIRPTNTPDFEVEVKLKYPRF